MKKHRRLIDSFSAKDWQEFKLLAVQSGSKRVRQCAEVIQKEPAILDNDMLIWRAVYKEQPFQQVTLNNLKQGLSALIRETLIRRETTLDDILHLRALLNRGLFKDFDGTFSAVSKKRSAKEVDSQKLLEDFQLHSLEDLRFGSQTSRHIDRSLQSKMDSLDAFYALEKLKGSCEMLNRNRILQEPFEIRTASFLNKIATRNDLLEIPLISIWFKVYQLLSESDSQSVFSKLLQQLDEFHLALPVEEIRAIYSHAQNYCIRNANAGKEGWLESLLKVYRLGLQNKVLLDGGQLSHTNYKNIVTVALRLNEFSWTAEFIEKYQQLIPESIRDNAYRYNRANFFYSQKQYEKAMLLLREVEFADVFYNLGAKVMLLKIYFEEDHFDLLTALIAAFRIYLKRNKTISTEQKSAYRNMINTTLQMARIRNRIAYQALPKTKADLEKVASLLSSGKPVMNISWVRSRFQELSAYH